MPLIIIQVKKISRLVALMFVVLLGLITIIASGGGGGGGGSEPADADGDGIVDIADNCINDANPGQEDADSDGIGDACEQPQNQEPSMFSLSGSILAPAVVAIDSDTNDPNAPFASNDTPNVAPTIANPISLGGYVNEAGTGEEGRSKDIGDFGDYFQVKLLAGQVITMLVSDYETGDADLYLYDSTGQNIVDFSIEVGRIESLTVAADGMYFVNPFAYSGATNYVLVIGNTSITSAGGMRLSSDFVPGQAVVRYDTRLARSQAQSIDSLAAESGFRIRAGAPERPMLLELDPGEASLKAQVVAGAFARSKASAFRDAEDRAKWETLMSIKALRNDPSVVYAEPNYIMRAAATPNDDYYPLQWHYSLINLPAAWDLETGDANVIVADIDTGVLLNHPDLLGQLVPGYDFISGTHSNDGDGIDANPDDPGDSSGNEPSSFHGTHVAGTIAAATNNQKGIAGVAWGVKIMPIRVLGVGGGFSYDIAQGVLYAAGLPNDSNTIPAQRADVMNLSLGGGSFSQASQDAYTAARQAGVIIVAAAGNETTSQLSYPASYDGVISVSAVDLERRLAWYSNFGTAIDVAAPGGDTAVDRNGDGYKDGVLSTLGDDLSGPITFTYKFYQGTSMAAPHAAGVFALMKSANGNVTPDFVDQQLIAGALTDDIGSSGRDDSFGHGLINAQKAVTAALNLVGTPPPDSPTLGVTPSTLNFDAATSAIEITAQNTSTGSLQLTSITPSQPWITVTSIAVDASNLGTYLVTVDRSSLADGIYSGEIALQSDVNTVNVSVVITVGAAGTGGDVGYIYVLLIDSDTGDVVDEVAPLPVGGSYSYAFSDVPAGTYEVLAGTDSDNDFFICDPGEACGVYLTIGQPIQLDVNGDQSNLNFPIGYIVTLPSVNASTKEVEKPKRGVSRLGKQPAKAIAR